MTRANENPWYLLATLHGEQPHGATITDFDRELADKNRASWNRWMLASQRVSSPHRSIGSHLLNDLSENELAEFRSQFAARAGDNRQILPSNSADQIDFTDVAFEKMVSFRGFFLPTNAKFTKAIFKADVDFAGSTFLSHTSFYGSKFFEIVNFHDAIFHGEAGFGTSESYRFSAFDSVKFCGSAFFRHATFAGDGHFERSVFYEAAYFRRCHFKKDALFAAASFSDEAKFNEVTFGGAADFRAADFQNQMTFADANFARTPPDFRDSKLREASEWHGVTWPRSPRNLVEAQQSIYAYERLKAEMERLKKHEDELFFFRQELRAKQSVLFFNAFIRKSPWSRFGDFASFLLSSAYDSLSEFGQSIARPLLWLCFLFFSGTVIYGSAESLDDGPMDWVDAAAFSATNIVSFLPYKPAKLITEHLSLTAKFFGNLQATLGLILLFLLGLALRNRFRMK